MNRKFVLFLSKGLLLTSLAWAEPGGPVRVPVSGLETKDVIAERFGVEPNRVHREDEVMRVEPPESGWPTHRVLPKQTLWSISKQYDVSVDLLRQANQLEDDKIRSGSTLYIPARPLPQWLKVTTEDGRVGYVRADQILDAPPTRLSGEALVDLARGWLGTPYRFGGQSTAGIDCSGYVQEIFRQAGHILPRTADKQFEAGEAVPAEQLRAGDLVFFETYSSGASHVGIYSGSGRFLHASSSHGVVETELSEKYYQERFLGARRME